MGFIPLTQGKVAIVDDQDVPWLSQWLWAYADDGVHARVMRSGYKGSGPTIMARLIMKARKTENVIHLNGDPLDCRRVNLKVVPHTLAVHRASMPRTNRSGYKGVTWNKERQEWRATISLSGKRQYLGKYLTAEAAAKAWNKAAREHYGADAYQNKIDE